MKPSQPARLELGAILAVAALAFRESARHRVLHALLLAMFLATAVSQVLAWVTGDELDRQLKVVGDVSLSALTLLGTIAAIFLGTSLVHQEVERRTVYTVLARPISRPGFLLGKYLGLTAIMGLAVLVMGLIFFGSYAVAGGFAEGTLARGSDLALAVALVYLELAVVVGVALFFSVAAHPIEGAVFAFMIALAGHMTASLKDLGAQLLKDAGSDPGVLTVVLVRLLDVAYVLLPNLENFNLRDQAVQGLAVGPAQVAGAVVYAAVYVALLLGLSSLVFRRKVL